MVSIGYLVFSAAFAHHPRLLVPLFIPELTGVTKPTHCLCRHCIQQHWKVRDDARAGANF
jgi:hypothetical protein